ncbi:MAG: aspartate aminotransferase family protein [bacterium]
MSARTGAPRAALSTSEIIAKHKQFVFPSVTTYYQSPLALARGEGASVWDTDGNRYLDFFGGILTVSVGHSHPKVVERVSEQIRALTHTSTLYMNEPMVALAEKLASIAPGALSKSYFTNSGTEADETAVTLARHFTGRQEVIALRHAYSGRSNMAMTLTAHASWRSSAIHDPEIRHSANAYCYRCAFEKTYPDCNTLCARDLESVIQTQTSGQIAAVIVEPIQGVGGFVTPPPEYFPEIARIARKYGGLVIADEVQTGFGRTGGKWFGIEQWGVEPEIMTAAKGIANGVPMGATIARADVADAFKGLTISTFGGNPVSCAAALATIEVIEEERLLENARVQGARLRAGLEAIAKSSPFVGEVRGMGLMVGVEIVSPTGAPSAIGARPPSAPHVGRLFEETRRRGLLIGKGGFYGNVLRITPALNITSEEIDRGLAILGDAFATLN